MKEVKLIEQALLQTQEPETKKLLEQFIRANTVINTKFDLFKLVDRQKDSMSPAHTGIFHDHGHKVATDGHILAAVRSDYEPVFEGKILKPDGSFVDEDYKFPKWKSYIPTDDSLTPVYFRTPVVEMIRKVKEEQNLAKVAKEEAYASLSLNDERKMFFKASYFVHVLNFVNEYPKTKFKTGRNCFCVKDAENFCLIMECKPENLEYVTVQQR